LVEKGRPINIDGLWIRVSKAIALCQSFKLPLAQLEIKNKNKKHWERLIKGRFGTSHGNY